MTTTFQQKRNVWEKRFASLKTLCNEPKLKEFQINLNLCTEFLQKESFFVMVSSQMMTVHIVAKGTPSIIHVLLATVFFCKTILT